MNNKPDSTNNEVKISEAGPLRKYIFLLAAAAVTAAGYFLRIRDTEVPVWGRALFSIALTGLAVLAAHSASLQRQKYMPDTDDGEDSDASPEKKQDSSPGKGKRFLYTLVYYLFCLIAVFCIVFCLWFCRILYI